MLGIVITTITFLIAMILTRFSIASEEVNSNWEAQRCRPDVMLMAGMYGKDAAENINFCLKSTFDGHSMEMSNPFYSIMGIFTQVLSTMISSINSVKVIFATIIGSTYTIFNEFSSRIKTLLYTIQNTAIRMKFMMGRVFAAINAILYMGIAVMRAGMNFERTDLWNTIRGFTCFDPDTEIAVSVNGSVINKKISDVVIGDTLAGAASNKVTATFRFIGDGQDMFMLPGNILVSGPHRLLHKGQWIHASCHPEAVPHGKWRGGKDIPLICLNTTDHVIRIGDYSFTDYDETIKGNTDAMEAAMLMINGKAVKETGEILRACHAKTPIKLKDGLSPADHIILGTETSHGTVNCVAKVLVDKVCMYRGDIFTPATALWSEGYGKYMRAHELVTPMKLRTPQIFYSFMISPSAVLETGRDTIFRDYLEVHDSQIESSYAKALDNSEQRLE